METEYAKAKMQKASQTSEQHFAGRQKTSHHGNFTKKTFDTNETHCRDNGYTE